MTHVSMMNWWHGQGGGDISKRIEFLLNLRNCCCCGLLLLLSLCPLQSIHLAYLAMDLWAELLSRLIKFIKNARHNNNNHIARQRSHWRLAATATAKQRSAVCSPRDTPLGREGHMTRRKAEIESEKTCETGKREDPP